MPALLLLTLLTAAPVHEPGSAASWIWYPEQVSSEGVGSPRYFRKTIRLAGAPRSAEVRMRLDDSGSLTVNGAPAPKARSNDAAGAVYDLAPLLHAGENVLGFQVTNAGGPGGLIVIGRMVDADGRAIDLFSDASFKVSRSGPDGWDRPGFDDTAWRPAMIVGSAFAAPWYGHEAFDLRPFITPADRAAYDAWRAAVLSLPPGLAGEQPARATIGLRNGQAVVTIDGRPRPALLYRGTVDPLTEHGRRQLALFRDAGVHLYCAYLDLGSLWPAPGKVSFDHLDDLVRGYLSVDHEAYVVLILRLLPPRWWREAHPEEMVGYATGPAEGEVDEAERTRRPSYASERWQQELMDLWRGAIAHLEAQPWGKRIIGYHPGNGIYTEWHYYGSWTNQMPDTGPAMTRYFRGWLQRRYGTDAALQAAWRRPEVTLATATVPGVEPRVAAGPLGLRDPAQGTWAEDYYRCQQELTAELVDRFCAAAKQVTGGRVFCGAFYGYYYGVAPQTQGGHLELERLLASPNVDYFTAPYAYDHRLPGDDGRFRAVADAFNLAGKVHLVEADTRTHLHPVDEYDRQPDAAGSIAAIRREVATALITGNALWWCDFGADGSGGWYDDPALIAEVKSVTAMAERLMARPRHGAAQVALIIDPRSCYALPDGPAMRAHYTLLERVTRELYDSGTPFDSFFASELPRADLARYKLLVVLDATQPDAATRAALAAAARGRSVLWLGTPGITDGRRLSAELTRALTGFPLTLHGDGLTVPRVSVPGDDPLLRALPATAVWRLDATGSTPIAEADVADHWYNPRDAETMKAYRTFDLRVDGNALRWTVATSDRWSDIHLKATVARPDGLGLEVSGEGAVVGTGLRVVLKDADQAEFVAAAVVVAAQPQHLSLPLAGFTKAPWSRATATAPRLPLTGLKFVLDGLGGGRAGTLVLRGLSSLQGRTVQERQRGYDVDSPTPVAGIAGEGVTPLAIDPVSQEAVLAVRGTAPARQVLSTVPVLPASLLRALMDEAGVARYVEAPGVIVRADDRLVELHTKVGGPIELHLPAPRTMVNALTGEPLGQSDRLKLTLPPSSTTLIELK